MRTIFFLLFLLPGLLCLAQGKNQTREVVVTSSEGKTRVSNSENGTLLVNVSPRDLKKFTRKGVVRYSNFGAAGDGETDDMDAIAATHAFANQHGLTVRADGGSTYYIGGKNRTAVIRTNTHFGKAEFIIDDTRVENRNAHVFLVGSGQLKRAFRLFISDIFSKSFVMLSLKLLPAPA